MSNQKTITVNSEQLEELCKAWFVYGHNGEEHSMANHSFIQTILSLGVGTHDSPIDHALKQFGNSISKSCLDKVTAILGVELGHVCICNNCDNEIIDQSPHHTSILKQLKGSELKMSFKRIEDNHYMYACPNCETDWYLSDVL